MPGHPEHILRNVAEIFYNILILALAIAGILRGFRRGLSGQVSAVLGFAFGAVCAHAFAPEFELVLRDWIPGISHKVGAGFIYSVIATGLIYIAVYCLFAGLTGILRGAMAVFHTGLLDSLFGAAFGCMKYLIGLSLLFNVIVCFQPDSVLLKSSTASDGNLIEGAMAIAPWVLGSLCYDDYAHILQLHEARKISKNETITYRNTLMIIEPGDS